MSAKFKWIPNCLKLFAPTQYIAKYLMCQVAHLAKIIWWLYLMQNSVGKLNKKRGKRSKTENKTK